MKTRLLIFFTYSFMLSLYGSLLAQSTLEGQITDLDGKVLPGANVGVAAASVGTTADAQGRYELKLPNGTHEVVVSFMGYENRRQTIELNDEAKTLNFTLKEAAFLSESITIKAVRAGENAPISQVTRTKEDIEAIYVGQDGAFLLEELSPSIVSYSESGTNFGNYAQIRLRGIEQTRINMTLNGVPLNDMIDQGVFFSNFMDFGNSISSVQIQRGVGTSTNGTSSYAGSINFESVQLSDSVPSTEVQLSGGSFNTRRMSAEVNTGKMDNNFAFYTRFSRIQSDGFRDNTGTDAYSFFFSGAYFAKKHTFKLTGFTGRSRNELGYLPVALADIKEDPKTNYIQQDEDNFGQWMAQLQHTYQIKSNLQLVNTIYYGGAGGDFPFGFEEGGQFAQINYPLFNRHLGAMNNLNWHSKDRKWDINTGLHAYTFERENIESIIPDDANPYYEDKSIKNEVSLFGKVTHRLNRWKFYGDVQVRGVSLSFLPDEDFLGEPAPDIENEWLFINPKAGVHYDITPALSSYVSFGRSGREPTRFDFLGSTQINAFNLPILQQQNAVKAEYVNNLEYGVRYNDGRLQVNTNFFYMQFENEIAPIGQFIEEGFVQVHENQASSYRGGIEMDYSYRMNPWLRLYGHATYMQAAIESYQPEGSEEVFRDVTPILTPDWNVQTKLDVQAVKNLTFTLATRYLSESYMELTNNSDLTVPASFITDLGISYHFGKGKNHRASLFLNNLTDELYYTYGAPVFTDEGLSPGYFVQPPRHFFLSLNFGF